MASLAVGVSKIKDQLPDPVYGLLSGLNSATVGIIALAAVQLAEKAIKDKLSRIVVIFGACAGLCYTALWYFPVLMVVGGATTALWDMWLERVCVGLRNKLTKRKTDEQAYVEDAASESLEMHIQENRISSSADVDAIRGAESNEAAGSISQTHNISNILETRPTDEAVKISKKDGLNAAVLNTHGHAIPVRLGIAIIIAFFCKYFYLFAMPYLPMKQYLLRQSWSSAPLFTLQHDRSRSLQTCTLLAPLSSAAAPS
jgi:chromate transporter